jgi:hypothetical protein
MSTPNVVAVGLLCVWLGVVLGNYWTTKFHCEELGAQSWTYQGNRIVCKQAGE